MIFKYQDNLRVGETKASLSVAGVGVQTSSDSGGHQIIKMGRFPSGAQFKAGTHSDFFVGS